MTIEPAPAEKVYPVPERLLAGGDIPRPFISSFDEYKAKWEESVKEPKKFFGDVCIIWHDKFYYINLYIHTYTYKPACS